MSQLLFIEVTPEVVIGGQPSEYGPRKTKQVAYLHGMSAYPDKWEMRYSHEKKPIEPGMYLLGAGSFRIGKYGPEINAPELTPLVDAVSQLQEKMGTVSKLRAAG